MEHFLYVLLWAVLMQLSALPSFIFSLLWHSFKLPFLPLTYFLSSIFPLTLTLFFLYHETGAKEGIIVFNGVAIFVLLSGILFFIPLSLYFQWRLNTYFYEKNNRH